MNIVYIIKKVKLLSNKKIKSLLTRVSSDSFDSCYNERKLVFHSRPVGAVEF